MTEHDAAQLPTPPRRLPISLSPTSSTPIVAGLAACVAGFGLIAYCWSQVALRTIVADQTAYVVSAGFTGLGSIVVGAMVAAIQVRRRDAEHHFRRLERLVFAASGKRPPERPATRDGSDDRKPSIAEARISALATSALAVIVGFVLIGFAWYRVSDEPQVAVQVPYLVSGGVVGLALICTGCAFAYVLLSRSIERKRSDLTSDLVAAVSGSRRGSA